MGFKWYDDVPENSPIEQGDILEKCSILLSNEQHYQHLLDGKKQEALLDVKEINAIVLSQSCDIQNMKIDSIIVCPIKSLKEFIVKGDFYKSTIARENLRQGKYPEYHLLQKFGTDGLPCDFYFVDFHHIYSVPKRFLEALAKSKSHKRLLSPYRENLSQSFARYFMRVGLPEGISKDEIRNYS